MTEGKIEGPTILLGSGRYWDAMDPTAVMPSLEDLAYGLGFEGRYANQCVQDGKRVFYGVAQHCVLGAKNAPNERLAWLFLMHESGEFAWGDLCGPFKRLVPQYRSAEKQTEQMLNKVWDALPANAEEEKLLKEIDRRMMATERRDIMNWKGEYWGYIGDALPYEDRINPWDGDRAAQRWMLEFDKLAPDNVRESFQ